MEVCLRLCALHDVQASADNAAEANRHTMLRPRSWWDAKFAEYGAVVNHEMLWAMQAKNQR